MPNPQPPHLTLWICENEAVQDQDLLNTYAGWLSEEEKQRWQRFRFARHRQQFLVARALVRSTLANYLDTHPASLVFSQNQWGKPALQPEVAGLQFNLSHTDGLVVLAVYEGTEENLLLGVDVENLERKAETGDLARRYFSEDEFQALQALDEAQQRQRFFDLWTLKEAYIKAVGMGLSIALDSFSFRFGDEVGIGFSPEREDDSRLWRFWQYWHGER